MAVSIGSHEELQVWLEGKPREWVRVIALRAALRVAPLVCDPDARISQPDRKRLPLAVFRAIATSLPAALYSADDIGLIAYKARTYSQASMHTAAQVAANSAAAYAPFHSAMSPSTGTDPISSAVFARASAAACAAAAVTVAVAATSSASFAVFTRASDAVADAFSSADGSSIWRAISWDCNALNDGQSPTALSATPLWADEPAWFSEVWGRAARWLSRPYEGFPLWREWYLCRLEGLPHAFERFDAAADEVFYRWIIERDDNWWKRDVAAVNTDIAAKITELRRPAPPSDEELAQNPLVINFALDAEGRTVLAPEPLPNGLLDDPDARDTHSEILRLIGAARLSCESGRTQATDMLGPVDLLAEAVGCDIQEVRPRLFVLRGKELIRQFEDRQRPESMATPLSVGQIDCFAPLTAAVRQLADEDTKLRGLWQGPDGGAPALENKQITALVDALKAVGQTTLDAQEALETAAGQVRPSASAADPARRSASEMLRNVFRSIGKRIKWVDDKSQAAIGFFDRMQDLWERVRSLLPDDDIISRLLDLFKGGGG